MVWFWSLSHLIQYNVGCNDFRLDFPFPVVRLVAAPMWTGSALVGKVTRLPFALNLFPRRALYAVGRRYLDDFGAQVAEQRRRKTSFVATSKRNDHREIVAFGRSFGNSFRDHKMGCFFAAIKPKIKQRIEMFVLIETLRAQSFFVYYSIIRDFL